MKGGQHDTPCEAGEVTFGKADGGGDERSARAWQAHGKRMASASYLSRHLELEESSFSLQLTYEPKRLVRKVPIVHRATYGCYTKAIIREILFA
jgi:hypothetical protein